LNGEKTAIIETTVKVNGTLAKKIEYTYDNQGNVISTAQQQNSELDFVYTDYTYTNGQLTSETCNGIQTSYTYDELGRLETTTDGRGNTTSYTYDALGNVTSITNPDNTSVTHTYNYTANTVTVTDENGASLIYTYTPLGQEYEIVDGQTNGVWEVWFMQENEMIYKVNLDAVTGEIYLIEPDEEGNG